MPEPAQHVEIIHTYFQQAVVQEDLESLDRLFEPDAASYGVDGREPVLGLEGQREFIRQLHDTIGDIRITIEDIIAADEKVAVRFILSGTTTADTIVPRVGDSHIGRITVIGHAIYHFVHGRIRDNWTNFELSEAPIPILITGILSLMTNDPEKRWWGSRGRRTKNNDS
jgi:predicted ester cyclase